MLKLKMVSMVLMSGLFALTSHAQLDDATAMGILSKNIMRSFRYHHAGSDHPLYSGYESDQVEMPQTQKAFIYLAARLKENPDDPTLTAFARANSENLGYWLAYFGSSLDYKNVPALSDVLRIPGAAPTEYGVAFNTYLHFYGGDFVKKCFTQMITRDPIFAHWGPHAGRVSPGMILHLRLQDNDMTDVATARESFPYGVFYLEDQLVTHSDFTQLLVALHQQGRLDIAKVFSASLFYYVYHYLSGLSGFYGSKYRDLDLKDHSDAWFDLVLAQIGTQKMVEILQEQLLRGDRRYETEGKSPEQKQEYFLKQSVGSDTDGIIRWATLLAPKEVKRQLLDWVLEQTFKGKDWNKFQDDYYRNAEDFKSLLGVGLTRHLKEVVAESEGKYKNAWDYFVDRKWISAEAAQSILSAHDLVAQLRQSIEANYLNELVQINAAETAPPPASRVGRALLNLRRYVSTPPEYVQLRALAERNRADALAALPTDGTWTDRNLRALTFEVLNLTSRQNWASRNIDHRYLPPLQTAASIQKLGVLQCEGIFR